MAGYVNMHPSRPWLDKVWLVRYMHSGFDFLQLSYEDSLKRWNHYYGPGYCICVRCRGIIKRNQKRSCPSCAKIRSEKKLRVSRSQAMREWRDMHHA